MRRFPLLLATAVLAWAAMPGAASAQVKIGTVKAGEYRTQPWTR